MSQHAKCPKGKTRRDQLHVLTAPSHSESQQLETVAACHERVCESPAAGVDQGMAGPGARKKQ